MARAQTVDVQLNLPKKLVDQASAVLHRRGSSLDDYVRLKLKGLLRPEQFYSVGHEYTFGKYRGEQVGVVINTDPEYVAWCLREIEGFGLDPEALDYLASTGVNL